MNGFVIHWQQTKQLLYEMVWWVKIWFNEGAASCIIMTEAVYFETLDFFCLPWPFRSYLSYISGPVSWGWLNGYFGREDSQRHLSHEQCPWSLHVSFPRSASHQYQNSSPTWYDGKIGDIIGYSTMLNTFV